jgi:hypothetical protein
MKRCCFHTWKHSKFFKPIFASTSSWSATELACPKVEVLLSTTTPKVLIEGVTLLLTTTVALVVKDFLASIIFPFQFVI